MSERKARNVRFRKQPTILLLAPLQRETGGGKGPSELKLVSQGPDVCASLAYLRKVGQVDGYSNREKKHIGEREQHALWALFGEGMSVIKQRG